MEGNQANSRLKILTLGESGVGKTCILLRFTGDYYFQHHINTIGVDYKQKELSIEENGTQKKVKLCIWDTAGQEKFRKIARSYYKGAHGIILTYDVTDENSFKNIRNWVKQIEQNAQTNVCKVLVGNKCDREDRKISYEEGAKLASEFKMQFFETSAKSNYNVNETFTFLTKEILSISDPKKETKDIVEIRKQNDKEDKKKSCC
mmetsp:Transcript_22293/g.23246  ORF Transcript_22293/g.23246 Transcript_22293/m.23246 type:complete len:204 (+) Transcript_22293:39-650(+)